MNLLNLQIFFENSRVYASSRHGDYRPSEGLHTMRGSAVSCQSLCLQATAQERRQ
jgi:hypothetical protein